MSDTLEKILNHWSGEFPPDNDISLVELPFDIEHFCIEMDSDYEELKAENQDLRAFAKYNFDTLTEANAQLVAENQRLREALNDLYSMASSPQWRNEPLYRICELLEKALEQSDETET